MMQKTPGQAPRAEVVAADMDEREVSKPKTAYQLYLHKHMHRMHNEIESTTRKLELEKRRLNKLEEDVARTRTEHDDKVLKVHHKELEKPSMRKLEHRLGKAIGELNKYNHENKEARGKIDQIRRERLQMNQVFKKLTNDIKDNIGHVTNLQKDTDGSRREHEER